MKISIEVEVEPNEFNLASELLRTLNLLTEHVKVRRSSSISGAAPSAAGPQAVSAPVPAAMPVAAPKATPPIPVPIPIVPSAAAAAPPGPPLPATPQDARRMFTEVLASVVDPRRLDAVAVELARLFESSSLSKQLLQDEFLEALFAVSFDQQHIAAEQSVAPFFYVLPKLPPAVKDTIKAKVIQKVLTHLNQKRPVTTRREEFYLQAEAFAVLSEMDFVSIDGAVQTIEKLLKNSEKRAAAITTLGKTVERSKDKVLAANPTLVGSLFSVLDNVTDQQFQYDIEWINNNMGRARSVVPAPASATPQTVSAAVPPPVAVPAAAAMPSIDRTKVKMQVTRTFQNAALGTAGTFFTLGWDPKDQHLISGGKEVPITVWASDGTVHKTIDCPGMYICCIDVEMQNQLILMCGIFDPPTDQYKSRIVVYDGRSNRNFAQMGEIKRAEVDMTAVVRALPGTANLITGESVRLPSGAFQEQISLYDLHHVVERHASITPTMTFNDHKNLVTCLAPLPTNPGVFVSGSRDNTVKVWDARSGPSALFTLGVPQGDFTATTHLEMVTCVDVAGDIVVSGSLDQSIAAWDLRTLGHTKPLAVAGQTSVCNQHGHQAQWTNSGILKACLDGSPIDKLAAVATVGGLYSVDFSTATPIITAANALSGDGTPKQYNDIRWATHAGRLYASAGEGATVDLLEIQQI